MAIHGRLVEVFNLAFQELRETKAI